MHYHCNDIKWYQLQFKKKSLIQACSLHLLSYCMHSVSNNYPNCLLLSSWIWKTLRMGRDIRNQRAWIQLLPHVSRPCIVLSTVSIVFFCLWRLNKLLRRYRSPSFMNYLRSTPHNSQWLNQIINIYLHSDQINITNSQYCMLPMNCSDLQYTKSVNIATSSDMKVAQFL